ncbi:MAG TPA: hypothetical protein VGQ08_17145 [Nitrospiraceae bacterium]|jgi:hypothetical protein|nr:hypothetical protein [Nitrospiraceae bacterium]
MIQIFEYLGSILKGYDIAKSPADTVLEGLEKEARKGCGLIRIRCRRGSGGSRAVEPDYRAEATRWRVQKIVGD